MSTPKTRHGPSMVLTLADDGFIYKTSRDSQVAAEVYPGSVTTPDLSSIQTKHKNCGARLTTEQQSHLMELWSNEQVI